MSREWESRLAVVGLLAGIAAGVAFTIGGRHESAFWSCAAGATAFYGFGCFGVWPGDDYTPEKRAAFRRIWFVHMYWMNGFGCLCGWGAARLAYLRFDSGVALGGVDLVLAVVAFLGLVGWLPYTLIGIAKAASNLAEKGLKLTTP